MDEFIKEVRETWDLRPHTTKEKLGAILSDVSGPARKEVDCQHPHVRSDPEAILEFLMAAFAEVVPVREAEMSFLGSHKKQSESLRDFSHRLFDEYAVTIKQQRRERVEPFGEEGSGTSLCMGSVTWDSDGSCLNLLNKLPQ